ncbi:sensor histidine kinase [Clostridium felsineum]|uniref:sensor histidine kinase n=1 Tax=Clostridium felsineum TaxID=36839 RepID=UPI0009CB2C23|nr:HAMP domain-containing sensor histidine kinase [Clostridium felsineum]URZ00292.1 Adaptive-response sensory-kinase SasA [Clostridium felsineum]
MKKLRFFQKTKGHFQIIKEMICKSLILQQATLFLIISCIVALVTLICVFILVSIFSKKAINPIIESMEKQKQFITDAGHEIKTPLAIISANADVLELTSGTNEWITSIRNQSNRLDRLVKNLLMLSKMNENLDLVFSDFNLSTAAVEITNSFEVIAEKQNKKLVMDIQSNIILKGEENGIRQLISTLVDNAIKYSNDNGTIKISLRAIKKSIKIEVYNTADNIDKENLDKLFDRFYRADSSRSRETGGYGIGLSIAKSIVERHRGKILAKSEDGKSICFTVLI